MTPESAGCKCETCPFSHGGKAKDYVMPEGPASPAGVVWCDIPTHDDARRGVPMAPNSQVGREWGASLQQAGLEREALLHVPATACKRPHGAKDSAVGKAVEACAPMREAAKELTEGGTPALVLGQFAWQALTGKRDGHADRRGFVDGNTCVTFRPELAYFWAPHEWECFDIDVRRFGRLITRDLEAPPRIEFSDQTEPLMEVVRRANAEGWVAFDIETAPTGSEEPWTGKDPTRAKLRTISLGWPDFGYSFFVDRVGREAMSAMTKLLASDKVLKVGHNIVWFDNRVLARHGLPVSNFIDTRDLRRSISSTSRLSLAYLATRYTDAPPWKVEKDEEAEDGTK
jgi:uracil-DNA glycosylase